MSEVTDAADRLEAALDPNKRNGWTRLMKGDDGLSEVDDLRRVIAAARSQAVSRPDRETIAALLGISDEYFDAIQGGEPENWSRLIDHLWKVSEALKAVSPPDRETIASLLTDNGPGWTSSSTYITREDALLAADAVLAAPSTQPAAGEDEWGDEGLDDVPTAAQWDAEAHS